MAQYQWKSIFEPFNLKAVRENKNIYEQILYMTFSRIDSSAVDGFLCDEEYIPKILFEERRFEFEKYNSIEYYHLNSKVGNLLIFIQNAI